MTFGNPSIQIQILVSQNAIGDSVMECWHTDMLIRPRGMQQWHPPRHHRRHSIQLRELCQLSVEQHLNLLKRTQFEWRFIPLGKAN